MVQIDEALRANSHLRAAMLLQIHDEIILGMVEMFRYWNSEDAGLQRCTMTTLRSFRTL